MIRPESMKEKVMAEIGTVQATGGKHVWLTLGWAKSKRNLVWRS